MALRISGDGSLNLSDVTLDNVTASGLSASGNVVLPSTTEIGAVSSTELGYVDGVTSALQTQLNAKAELSAGYQYHSTVYFTSNGTFTKASYPWLRAIRVKCQAGGGGGGGVPPTASSQAAAGSGGSGGGYSETFITDVGSLTSSVTVTVGSGGTGGDGTNAGSNGGGSSFGAGESFEVLANGGSGSNRSSLSGIRISNGAAAPAAGVGDFTVRGGDGFGSHSNSIDNIALGGQGGDSYLGFGGRGRFITGDNASTGSSANQYGGGGGGSCSGNNNASIVNGGSGSSGIVIVELYA